MIKTRFYNTSDYKAVKNILEECNYFDKDWDKIENLERKVSRDPESIIVAADEEKVIGNIFLIEDGWTGFLFHLAVKSDYQKQGVGSLLIQKAEEILKERKISKISVYVRNEPELIEFYKKRNYEIYVNTNRLVKKL